MENKKLVFVLIAGMLILGCSEEKKQERMTAEANIYATTQNEDGSFTMSSELYGKAFFIEDNGVVSINITTEKEMANPLQAVHLHFGSCESPGMHWNYENGEGTFCRSLSMGEPWGRPKAGDIGNLERGSDGKGSFELATDLWSLTSNDEKNILGAVLIVHQNFEDFAQECFENHTHMHNNPKIACGSVDLIAID